MKIKTLSYLLIPVLGFAASASMADPMTLAPQFPTQTMTLTVINTTSCKLVADTSIQNPCKGMPTVRANGGQQTFTCPVNHSLSLYHNPNAAMNHDSALTFHHNVVPGQYSYFMQSQAWDAGTSVVYKVNGTALTGSTSTILSDDGQGSRNVITTPAVSIVVSGGPLCKK